MFTEVNPSFDLHASSTPPAFNLNQDQILTENKLLKIWVKYNFVYDLNRNYRITTDHCIAQALNINACTLPFFHCQKNKYGPCKGPILLNFDLVINLVRKKLKTYRIKHYSRKGILLFSGNMFTNISDWIYYMSILYWSWTAIPAILSSTLFEGAIIYLFPYPGLRFACPGLLSKTHFVGFSLHVYEKKIPTHEEVVKKLNFHPI